MYSVYYKRNSTGTQMIKCFKEAFTRSQILVCTVFPDLSVQNLRIIAVHANKLVAVKGHNWNLINYHTIYLGSDHLIFIGGWGVEMFSGFDILFIREILSFYLHIIQNVH